MKSITYRKEAIFLCLWACATTLLIFAPVLKGEVIYFRDIYRFFVPGKVVIANALLNGEFPFWNPYVFSGMPLLPQLGLGIAYPPNALFLIFDAGVAITWYIVPHYPATLMAMYLFLRTLKLRLLSSAAAATGYAWCGIMLSDSSFASHLPVFLFAPLLLAVIQTWDGRKLFVSVGILWAIVATTGSAERLLGLSLIMLLYSYLFFGRKKFGLCLIALASATLIVAPIWLPSVIYLKSESRRMAGLTWAEVSENSMGIVETFSFFLPFSFINADGNVAAKHIFSKGFPLYPSIYAGVAGTFFFLSATLGNSRKFWPENVTHRNPYLRFWFITICISMLLALGKHTPVFSLIWSYVPILSNFRYPIKYLFFAVLGFSVLCGYGVDLWLSKPRASKTLAALAIGIILTMFATLLIVVNLSDDRLVHEHIYQIFPTAVFETLVFLSILLLTCATIDRSRLVPLLIPVLIFFDLVSVSGKLALTTDSDIYDAPPVASMIQNDRFVSDPSWFYANRAPMLEEGLPTAANLRLGLLPNLGSLWGLRQADGYEIFTPLTTEKYFHKVDLSDDGGAELLGKLGVRWKLMPRNSRPLPDPWLLKVDDYASGLRCYENPLAKPRARLQSGRGRVEITREKNSMVEIEVSTDTQTKLILADAYALGWSATVNSRPVPIESPEGMTRLVDVPIGASKVVFRYQPPGLVASLLVSLLGCVFYLIGVIKIR
ncbi:MAG: YfhO family protein [Candidatus Lindowbacteria bacterium]|nr:YfhO family protein [Candidatus Lindowbacteria bacterium]